MRLFVGTIGFCTGLAKHYITYDWVVESILFVAFSVWYMQVVQPRMEAWLNKGTEQEKEIKKIKQIRGHVYLVMAFILGMFYMAFFYKPL